MSLKKILLTSLLLLAPLNLFGQEYPLDKNGKTTSKGVKEYVLKNDSIINKQFDNHFNVNSYYLDFVPDNMKYYNNYKGEKGLYLGNKGRGEVIIDTVIPFDNYSLNLLSKKEKRKFLWNDDFVRGTMIHEKAHGFYHQLKNILELKNKEVFIKTNPSEDYLFRKSFVEEGVCQYCAYKMNEIIISKEYKNKENLEKLISEKNLELIYRYSLDYFKDFLDFFGLKNGIKILLKNPPPTKQEISNPIKFYKGLDYEGIGMDLFIKSLKPQDFKTK